MLRAQTLLTIPITTSFSVLKIIGPQIENETDPPHLTGKKQLIKSSITQIDK